MREALSGMRLSRFLRWLLPLGLAAIGVAHAGATRLLIEGPTYQFWVEVVLFGLLGPLVAWWLLGVAVATGERELQGQQRLSQIEEAARAVVSSLELEEVLQRMCSLATAQPGINMVWVGLIEPGSFLIKPAAAAGTPTDYLQDITVTWDDSLTGRGPTGTAVRTSQPVTENDIAGSFGFAPWREAALARGFRSSMAIPLRAGDWTLGALNLYSGQPGFFSPEVAQGFTIFADQAAVAIANARLLTENNRRVALLDELSARLSAGLSPSAILQATVTAARELLGVQYAAALLRDAPGEAPTHFVTAGWETATEACPLGPPRGRGLLGLVLESGEALRLADLSQHPMTGGFPLGHPAMKSLLVVPIATHEGKVLGCLYVTDKAGVAEFSAEDERMAFILARQVAVALEDARLLEENQQRARRLEVINEIARILAVAPKLEEVFPQVAEKLGQIISFDRAAVTMADERTGNAWVVAQQTDAPTSLGLGVVFPLASSSVGWVVEHNEPYFATDLAQERRFDNDETLYDEGYRSYLRLPLYSRGRAIGVLALTSRQPDAFGPEALDILQPIAGHVGPAIDNIQMLEELRTRSEQLATVSQSLTEQVVQLESTQRHLQEAYLGILRTLNLAMESRDPYLRGHSDRDAHYARTVARHMGLSEEEARWVETAAQLHDIGKLAIPDSVLLKPGPLEPSEWAVMYRHPTIAVDMLRFLDFMAPALPLIEGDHERWDGGGYPHGLKDDEIPVGARILAVTDAYDAMTSSRPYRPAMSHERACQILREGASSQWDPKVVEAFLEVYGTAPPR